MSMRGGILTVSAFVSALLFPWPLTALLALVAAIFEPMVPLAVGLFADTLYYVPQEGAMPAFTLFGLAAALAAAFVRTRLRESIIWG